MLRGFIIGLIFSAVVVGGLMVLFPPAVEAPMEAMTEETMAPAEEGATEEDVMEEGVTEEGAMEPDAGAEETAPAEATPPAEPDATSEPATDDQSSAPVEAEVETAAVGEGAVRLPTVKPAAETLKAPVTEAADQPAWKRNAVSFEAPGDRPLLAIVLTAVLGNNTPTTPLSEIDAPMTFALPAMAPGADQAAIAYQRAGVETLLVLSFATTPDGAIAPNLSDTEIAETVRAYFDKFESVVGVASPGEGAKTQARVARVVMREMEARGLAYLHGAGGAAAPEIRVAEELSLAHARHVRLINAEQGVAEVLQTLDLAAFDARRRGAAVAMGPPTEAMVQAVLQWAREKNGKSARLAPFSAVLARLERDG